MARNTSHPTHERLQDVMHHHVIHALASARRRATRAWNAGVTGGPLALSLALSLALTITGCQRSESTITALDDAATARIGVMGGSVGETAVAERFPAAEVQTFDDIMDAVAAMRAGHLDAVVVGYPAALMVTKKNPDLTLVPGPLASENTAIGARLTDTVLMAEVNRALDSLRADGTLADMEKRWLKADLLPYTVPDIVPSTTGEPLTIGVAATREPISFVDGDGKITGHDSELARRVGARLGRPIVFANMKFMALIPALQAGKIDLIVTGMSATVERRKRVAHDRRRGHGDDRRDAGVGA
jgi:polar amino acid transport system substrate-binding protein